MSSVSLDYVRPFIDLLPFLKNLTVSLDCYRRRASSHTRAGPLIATANSAHYRVLCIKHQPREAALQNERSQPLAESRPTDTNLQPPKTATLKAKPGLVNRPVQWKPAVSTMASSPLAIQTLEIMRLTTLIYSDLVIFPLGFVSGVRFMLARSLHAILRRPSTYLISEPNLEMWVLFMGAIACLPDQLSSPPGAWLVEKLKNMIGFICGKVDPKGTFLRIMEGFLWWDHVFGAYFRDLWGHLYPDTAQEVLHPPSHQHSMPPRPQNSP